MKNLKQIARAYALKNAISHDGRAQQGAVISGLFAEGLKKDEVKKYIKDIGDILKEINKLSFEEQKVLFEKHKKEISEREVREGLPELPNAKKGKVVMRVAPSASGPLHVMHAINASLSFGFIQKYGGKFIVRIEDTNPENVYPRADKMIEKDIEWLFKGKAKIYVQSDRMDLYYKYAENLLKLGDAYVCTCPQEKFKELIDSKEACPCRGLDLKEHIQRWKNMLSKKGYKPGEAVLRFKSDVKNKNPALRDFPLARINLTKHPRQKNKYRVWPLMNLAVAVDDIEMKMTHIIRGKDHRDNAERQKLIFKALGKNYPWTAFLGRYHFKDMELSTTKFKEGIKAGKYSGWDDPKLPTVVSLKKRKYKPEAFWKMAEHIGISEVDKVISQEDFFNLLDRFN